MGSIKDVAKRSGVAKSTVSYVLSKKKPVSENTKKRVLAAIEELNYRPNAIARSLATKKTNILAYIGPVFKGKGSEEEFYGGVISWNNIINGIICVANKEKYKLLVEIQRIDDKGDFYVDLKDTQPVDGLIVYNLDIKSHYLRQLQEQNLPVVLIGRPYPSVDLSYIDNDHYEIFHYLTSFMLNKGKKRILFINGPLGYKACKSRYKGYVIAHKELARELCSDLVINTDYAYENAYNETRIALEKNISFDSVITPLDLMASGAIKALAEKGIGVPEQVDVIGGGNTNIAITSQPELTSVDIFAAEAGKKAARLLIEIINGNIEGPTQISIPFELFVRQSTK